MREPLAKEQVYGRPTEVFVAPPWRWSDWSWAILAAVGGVMSAVTLLVLLSTTQLATDNGQFAPATSAMAVAARAAPRPAPVEVPPAEPAAPPIAAPEQPAASEEATPETPPRSERKLKKRPERRARRPR